MINRDEGRLFQSVRHSPFRVGCHQTEDVVLLSSVQQQVFDFFWLLFIHQTKADP